MLNKNKDCSYNIVLIWINNPNVKLKEIKKNLNSKHIKMLNFYQ